MPASVFESLSFDDDAARRYDEICSNLRYARQAYPLYQKEGINAYEN